MFSMLKRIAEFASLALSSSLAFASIPYYPVTFPRDEAAHFENVPYDFRQLMEWWYLNGKLLTDEGKNFGYYVSMFNPVTRNVNRTVNQPLLRIQVSLLDAKKNYETETQFEPGTRRFSSDK